MKPSPVCLKRYPPIIDIVIAVINAGYAGVVIDEKKLANGRFILCLSVNHETPEGRIIQTLAMAANNGKSLPSIQFALEQIEKIYTIHKDDDHA